MFKYLRERWQTAQLKAKYERRIQENLLQMVEVTGPQPVSEDPGDWMLVGQNKVTQTPQERGDQRQQVREMVRENPHARNILRLMEIYVVGPGLGLKHQAKKLSAGVDQEILHQADRLWKEFLGSNLRHFSYREYARRTWRDGEVFVRGFATAQWPPTVRFVDPEQVSATPEHPDSEGILTVEHDVETPVMYLQVNPATQELLAEIPAEEMIHTRIGVDSNQKRGESFFKPLLSSLTAFNKWVDTEMLARKLQASIVLWRKVNGSPAQASSLADAAQTSSYRQAGETVRREKFTPGTILTTSQGTDLQYLQPNTNFGDAVPLGRLMLLCTAAGAGLPEFMLTSDASNSNYSSTMVAEGPAVKLFQSEQKFFADELLKLWRWVMREAIRMGELPDDFLEHYEVSWSFPQLVNRERTKERLADSRLVEDKILSRAEVARRDGVDPQLMQTEIEEELSVLGEISPDGKSPDVGGAEKGGMAA